MTIIFNFPKYDYSQYDNNFKKIVILENYNMTTKKRPMKSTRGSAPAPASNFRFLIRILQPNHGAVAGAGA